MESQQPSQEQNQMIAARMALENSFHSGAGWFYWIAGLSIVNSAVFVMGQDWSFVIGLGMTQFVDGIVYGLMEEGAAASVKYIGFGIDVAVSSIFLLFGLFANKGQAWAFLVGMAVYFLDGLIFLLVQDWLSLGFHGFALYCIWGGFQSFKHLQALDQQGDQASMGEIH